ncbi:MAG: VWA domain-containing protein, partial [Desulfobacteraceae bacterium]
MQLLNPGMLAVLGLIPVLLLIHALKPRPRPLEVTNLFLWQQVSKERTGGRMFEKIRQSLPLLLQISLVALAALALSRPVWSFLTVKTGDMILVVDTSASMKTRTGQGTRFELAREKMRALIDRRQKNQKILMIEAGREPKLASGFIDDPNEAKSLVETLRPRDAPGRLEQAVALALSFVDPSREDTVYLITDGAGFDLPGLLQMHPAIVPVLIAGGDRNIGITKFEFRQDPD